MTKFYVPIAAEKEKPAAAPKRPSLKGDKLVPALGFQLSAFNDVLVLTSLIYTTYYVLSSNNCSFQFFDSSFIL